MFLGKFRRLLVILIMGNCGLDYAEGKINKELRNAVGKAGSEREVPLSKSAATLHACLRDSNVFAYGNYVLSMPYC